MAAEVILSEIAAFAKPQLNMQNNQQDITKLSHWATKMKSDINKGNLSGLTSLSSLLKSLIFPNLWKQNGSSVPEIADVHIPERDPFENDDPEQCFRVPGRRTEIRWKDG